METEIPTGQIEIECREVREWMSRVPLQDLLIAEGRLVHTRLASAIDSIEDTDRVLTRYRLRHTSCNDSHLLMYGLLNALAIQQESVTSAFRALNIEQPLSGNLKFIKRLRVAAAAHPSSEGPDWKTVNKLNFVVHSSISTTKFELQTIHVNGAFEVGRHKYDDLIDTQSAELINHIQAITRELKRRNVEHRKKFRSEKLQDLLFQNIRKEDPPTHQSVLSVICTLITAMKRRGQTSWEKDWSREADRINKLAEDGSLDQSQLGSTWESLQEAAVYIDDVYSRSD